MAEPGPDLRKPASCSERFRVFNRLALARVCPRFADLPTVAGALRGMGAVAQA